MALSPLLASLSGEAFLFVQRDDDGGDTWGLAVLVEIEVSEPHTTTVCFLGLGATQLVIVVAVVE